MKKDGSRIRQLVFLAGGVFALWLTVVAYARMIAPDEGHDVPLKTVELSRQEIRRLSLLHGTNVIKVERGTVSILRDGRWIPVPRAEQG